MNIVANTFTSGGVGVAEGASAGFYALVGQVGGANGMLLTRFFIIFHALLGLPSFLLNRRRIVRQESFIPDKKQNSIGLQNIGLKG